MGLFAVWTSSVTEHIFIRSLSDACDIHTLKLRIKNIPNEALVIEAQSSGIAQDIFREYKEKEPI